jgi:hypothetical protein
MTEDSVGYVGLRLIIPVSDCRVEIDEAMRFGC